MAETNTIAGQNITIHKYNTVIVGAGAAGMNCAKKLHQFMSEKGVESPEKRIAVVTAGKALGASRMSGSDKQTYYKLGTSPEVKDSAQSMAESLTAAGCCHEDLALIESIGSLRGFYDLVEAGVPFPKDSIGSFVGYKTDHDPFERATSAGPKTSKNMSECIEKQVLSLGLQIFDHQEAAHMLTAGTGEEKRIKAIVTINKKELAEDNYGLNIFYCENLVLAAGGPGELYKTSVYPKGQTGIHGLAFKAGLAAENLTESQFGLASMKFRWNVSGTYMQAIPRIFSTDADGSDTKDFLANFFPSMSKMATAIFLKGYQWPFDPQRIENYQSSLIDILVHCEIQKGRKVYLDFTQNPKADVIMNEFDVGDLGDEALDYLKAAGALQKSPIERLAHMNPLAIEIYKEHNIDLYSEPLEIAVCAQHNNGGFAVNKWWESNIKHTFVIGEMAGTHGVKRPGGAALNAGQVGALRAAEFIANAYSPEIAECLSDESQICELIERFDSYKASNSDLRASEVIDKIQGLMSEAAGHIRKIESAQNGLRDATQLVERIEGGGFRLEEAKDLIGAIEAGHLAISSAGYLKAIVELLKAGGGSRGSHLVLADDGTEIHPEIKDCESGESLRIRCENEELRTSILRVQYDEGSEERFHCKQIAVRKAEFSRKAFESAWAEYLEGKIYE